MLPTESADSRPIDDGYNLVHTVSVLQWVVADLLRLKIPRALCGERLIADPNRPDPMDIGAPRCPACAAITGDRDESALTTRRNS